MRCSVARSLNDHAPVVELVANDRPAIEQQDLCDGAYAMRQVGAARTGRRVRSDENGPDHPNGSWDIDPEP